MRRLLVGLAAASTALLSGCGHGPDLGDVPMPQLVSGRTYTVTMEVDSALNLPRQAPVRLAGKTVGEVESVRADDYHARVRLRLSKKVVVPADSRAEIRLSAPIGESFVALLPPARTSSAGPLVNGSTIDLAHTRAAPDTTDLLTSLSVAVTGGSYADLKTVVTELTSALDGHTDQVRHLLNRLDVLVTSLNGHRAEIDQALDGLDRLSTQLAGDSDSLTTSTKRLTPAIQELARQQDHAMRMLTSLTKLGDASTHVIEATSKHLGQQLRNATTLLDTVIAAQDKLEPTLKGLTGFADGLDAATPGDYTMFDLTIMAQPTITGLPFVNLDGSNPIEVPELSPITLPDLPFIGKVPLIGGLTSLLSGLTTTRGGR